MFLKVCRAVKFNDSILVKDFTMKDGLFKTLTGLRDIRWKLGTSFRSESSLGDPTRRLNHPSNAIIQTSRIEMRNHVVGQTPRGLADTLHSHNQGVRTETTINADNSRVTQPLFNHPAGSHAY